MIQRIFEKRIETEETACRVSEEFVFSQTFVPMQKLTTFIIHLTGRIISHLKKSVAQMYTFGDDSDRFFLHSAESVS